MKAIVNPEVAKFVDGLVARHVVSADPHVVERLKVEVEDFVNGFTAAEDETEAEYIARVNAGNIRDNPATSSQPSAADLDAIAAEQKAAAETTEQGDGSEIN